MQNLNTVSISVDQIQKLPIIRKISGIFLVNWHKKGCLYLLYVLWGVDYESEVRFWRSASENRFFADLL